MINQVFLVGNLGRDPDLRTFPNGTQVCKFTLGVSRAVKVDGSYQYATDWFHVTCFNKTAERLAAQGHKGLRVFVSGSLRNNSYTRKDGTEVRDTQIIADKVIFNVPKQENSDEFQETKEKLNAWDRDLSQEPIFTDEEPPF
jgi:single-strand DNA-binding protein